MPNFKLNQPITFKEGTGLTIDQNNIELYVIDHTGVIFSIGQAVGSGSNVQFNEVTSSKIIIDNGSLILSSNTISGSLLILKYELRYELRFEIEIQKYQPCYIILIQS